MKPRTAIIRPGDLVEVKSPREILQTLDANGTLDQLPFMPEMLEFCGKRFRVSRRVLKTCNSGPSAGMGAFRSDDVVLLEGLRCSGADHDGCQKACVIFWREAWLRKVDNGAPSSVTGEGIEQLRDRLKTLTGPKTYFCQASELLKATEPLSRWQRIAKCFSEIHVGNCTTLEMAQWLGIWAFWKIRRKVLGTYARGNKKSTPTECLNLQPGERVEVKSMKSIIETMSETGRNRGLLFFPNMRQLCGQQHRVERRLDKIIVDGTGEMRQLHNTVYLEGSFCGCPQIAFGGCARCEYAYWREIWLRRPANPSLLSDASHRDERTVCPSCR
jgi:hypothetical protein